MSPLSDAQQQSLDVWYEHLVLAFGDRWNVDAMRCLCNWGEMKPFHFALRVGSYEYGYAHINPADFDWDKTQVIRELQRQLDWHAERKVLDNLSAKERKLRQALAIVFSCSTSAEKVKERANKMKDMSDAGLAMMLGHLGVRQERILEIINSK